MSSNLPADARTRFPARPPRRWGAPVDAIVAGLELFASEQPEHLDFQVHVLAHSPMSYAVQKLATELGVAPEELGPTIVRACRDLDRLEKYRGSWQDPTRILRSPNLAALLRAGTARLSRVGRLPRVRRLQRILRRIEKAHDLAQTRAWVHDFIGLLPSSTD